MKRNEVTEKSADVVVVGSGAAGMAAALTAAEGGASVIFDMRAAKFRADSYSSLMDSLLEALRPPLLRVTQDTGHYTFSP
jgi:NADPH-dependent 2,4-dienoyl-CoA reductase/sulfur reductase-like enzyme